MSMENQGGDVVGADIEDQLPGAPSYASTPHFIFRLARHIAAFPFIIFSICLNAYIRKLDGCLVKLLFGVDFTVLFPEQTTSASYIKMKKTPPNMFTPLRRLSMVTTARLGCLVSLWLVVNLSISSFKRVTLFGCLLWKWSLLATVILLGYPFLFITYFLVLSLLLDVPGFKGSNMHYCIRGLQSSMRLLIHFISILVVWLLCIRTNNSDLNRYGTLTLSSFLAGVVLMVVKSVALLWWKTKYIYKKYEGKILAAGCQLYFLLRVMDQGDLLHQLLVPWWWHPSKQGKTEGSGDNNGQETENKADNNRRASQHKIPPIEKHMLEKNARLRQIEQVALYLIGDFELTLTEDDDMPNIVENLRRRFASNPGQEFGILTTVCEKSSLMDESEAQLLLELLQLETSNVNVNVNPTYEEFEKWMVDGLKRSYAAGHRLNGAFELMRILARVLTIFIIVVVILIWLFITGFATTKVVVGLASVFLGLTFMFGDACKTFFQGVIFSFVTHPFDVGDQCIIDKEKLDVKKINILTTAFFGNRRKVIVLYPNSDLAIKPITILKGEPELEPELEQKIDQEPNPKLKLKQEPQPEQELEPEPQPEPTQVDHEPKPEPNLALEHELKPKGEPEPEPANLEGVIEFNLHSSTTTSQIIALQENIEGFLEVGIESGHYRRPYAVTLKEIGDSLKMAIYFNHKLDNGDVRDQLESLQLRKSKQRSTFLLQIKQYLEDYSSANQDCSKTGKEAMVSPMHHA